MSFLFLVLLGLHSARALPSRTTGFARGLSIGQELLARAATPAVPQTPSVKAVKAEVLETLAPYGDPALSLPEEVEAKVDSLCRQLEACNPTPQPATAQIDSQAGRWAVRWSNAPPPSNGALGPFRGNAFQTIDPATASYVNELSLFNGALTVALAAEYSASSDESLRVAFRTLTFNILGLSLPSIKFPEGTERTWLLTYTDSDTRVVRAGVDGGRSTVRDLGIIERDEGEAADSYLFYLTRAPNEQKAAGGLGAAQERRKLKAELMAACEGANLGADSNEQEVQEISSIIDRLATFNPTPDAASSQLLTGRWNVLWTTEAELLFLTSKGFFGLPCSAAYQTISVDSDGYSLGNRIEFEDSNGETGKLAVESSCEPSAQGGRVDFKFRSCSARWKKIESPLPPVGTGWFEVVYLDNELRVAKDSRGDLQVCLRGK